MPIHPLLCAQHPIVPNLAAGGNGATINVPGLAVSVFDSMNKFAHRFQTVAPQKPPVTYAILLFPGFPMMAFSSIVEPLRAANLIQGAPCYSWTIVGRSAVPIKSSNGVLVEPEHTVHHHFAADRVVVCSGGDADAIDADDAMVWIRQMLRSGAHLGAVADAAFFLARGGFLDGYACTLHWTSQPAFSELFPHIELRRDLYVLDRKRFTSAGGVASFDMMLALIAQDHDAHLAAAVAEWFMHSPLRAEVDRRLMPIRLRTGIQDALVLDAVAVMEEVVEHRLTMTDLAERLAVSLDKLERAFHTATGMTPLAYYRQLRLRRAHDMLIHCNLPIREVALACGYDSLASFGRAFREAYGKAPRDTRKRLAGDKDDSAN